MGIKITPEVLDNCQNPKVYIMRPDLEPDIQAFIKAGSANPYRLAGWMQAGIPDLVELFMTLDQFRQWQPIPELLDLVYGGATRYQQYLDNKYTNGKLLHHADANDLKRIGLDPWAYLPKAFECTESWRNRLLTNLQTMKAWDKKRVTRIIKDHKKVFKCKKKICKFQQI